MAQVRRLEVAIVRDVTVGVVGAGLIAQAVADLVRV